MGRLYHFRVAVYYVAMKRSVPTSTHMSDHASIVLDDIRSSHNVGSIFRTADALGLGKSKTIGLYLAGYTPSPKDKFGRANKDIAKVALGAEETVSWQSVKSVTSLIKKLQTNGVRVVAVEQSPRAIDYKKFRMRGPTAFVFGNEVTGVSEKTLALCDEVIEIPMLGEKESLNVSVALGIAMARVLGL